MTFIELFYTAGTVTSVVALCFGFYARSKAKEIRKRKAGERSSVHSSMTIKELQAYLNKSLSAQRQRQRQRQHVVFRHSEYRASEPNSELSQAHKPHHERPAHG